MRPHLSKLHWLAIMGPTIRRFPRFYYALSMFIGWGLYHGFPSYGRNVTRNMLPLCDGDLARARKEGRRACQMAAQYYVDLIAMPRRQHMENFERDHLTVINGERLTVLEQPGPIVAVSTHTGNVELAVQALIYRGRHFVALVEALEPPEWSQEVLKMRSSIGGGFYEANFTGVRTCLEALKRGEVLGLMGDRDIQDTGVCTEFFGRRVKLPRGPWELARRGDALILPVFCRRTHTDNFEVHVEEPFKVPHTSDPEHDIHCAAAHFATLAEAHLRAEPGQWLVLEDFWRVHACAGAESEGEHVCSGGGSHGQS
ncbi:MAG: lysophospholipid acyltransferase family protein [Tepidiformaceae bacterium]